MIAATGNIEVAFRRATLEDSALILTWRNDPFVRARDGYSEEINETDHLSWMQRMLRPGLPFLYIAIAINDMPMGFLVWDADGSAASFRFTLAPEQRGHKGILKGLLREGPSIVPIQAYRF